MGALCLDARWIAVGALLLGPLAGCSCGTGNLAPADDAGLDARDSAAGLDAQFPVDSAAPSDDGGAAWDATADVVTFDCGSCPDPGPCERLDCDTACRYSALDDGTACGADSICVDGACVLRGCGDGFREPGPDPAREPCDDGNDVLSDACAVCVPQAVALASAPGGDDTTLGPRAIAVDGRGHALALVTRRSLGGGADLLGVELDSRGVPVASPALPLGGAPETTGAAVAGLDEGWAVVVAGSTVSLRIVRGGSVSASVDAAQGMKGIWRDATVTAVAGGDLLVAWTDNTTPTAPRALLRWMHPAGDPAEPISIAAERAASPVVATGPDALVLVTWLDASSASRLVGRRRTRSDWVDPEPFVISAARAAMVAVAPAPDGWWVAWVDRSADSEGDVLVQHVASAGTPIDRSAETAASSPGAAELAPSIAARESGWLAAWNVRYPPGIDMAFGGSVAPAETSILLAALTDDSEQGPSLAASHRGTWLLWSDDGHEVGDPSAVRSVFTFLLPPL